MLEDYKNALKSGQRAYRACVARGQSPYLAVLDDILVNVNIVAQEPLGLVEIPAESIVGTKTSGRHTAFAPNFMPLLEPDTEFAGKWSNLCDAHLEEGIHTPIIAYEFLNKFYVQEGNKRVSVLKYFDAVRIAGTVTRLVPERNDSLENRIYYEFLDFYKLSKVNDVHFSRLGGYAKLQTLVCKASGESWTDDDHVPPAVSGSGRRRTESDCRRCHAGVSVGLPLRGCLREHAQPDEAESGKAVG